VTTARQLLEVFRTQLKESVMKTAREMADLFQEQRRQAWAKTDPTSSIVAIEKLSPEDEAIVRRLVETQGYQGEELDSMTKRVSALVVGQVEAMADDMPADGGD
jgi:hypothetical protein